MAVAQNRLLYLDAGHRSMKQYSRAAFNYSSVYFIRADGTIALPVGERPPTFPDPFYESAHTAHTAHLERLARARWTTLISVVNQRHPTTTE